MQVKRDQDATIVRFSATEVASVGGPPKGCEITYRNGLLDNLSSWLFKQSYLEPVIDRLQQLADKEVGYV